MGSHPNHSAHTAEAKPMKKPVFAWRKAILCLLVLLYGLLVWPAVEMSPVIFGVLMMMMAATLIDPLDWKKVALVLSPIVTYPVVMYGAVYIMNTWMRSPGALPQQLGKYLVDPMLVLFFLMTVFFITYAQLFKKYWEWVDESLAYIFFAAVLAMIFLYGITFSPFVRGDFSAFLVTLFFFSMPFALFCYLAGIYIKKLVK